jgi:hypothetical protein
MASHLNFRTAVLPPLGYRRVARLLPVTGRIMVRRYGGIFGALAAAPFSESEGLGIPVEKLTFGLLVFPAVWDWFLGWREKHRGFITRTETSILYEAKTALRRPTGWIRQHRTLSSAIYPIEGLVSARDVAKAKSDWSIACDGAYAHVCDRIPELYRASRKHRDAFLSILPVLTAEKPLDEYRKIATELVRLMPDRTTQPVEHAVAVRAYLMLRFAIHLGFRQRNLRELLFSAKGSRHRTTVKLDALCCGELRWNDVVNGWEVFSPASAFKNRDSSYFRDRPFSLLLPNLENLYDWIDQYLERDRKLLLGDCNDPGTFFVKWVRHKAVTPRLNEFNFYSIWKEMIRRYGIFNPYTNRGAITGLLPHGPHCVRDVVATHVLKETGSYELAGFAIQDSPRAVMANYTRFLPHEKAALAAAVTNKVWQ